MMSKLIFAALYIVGSASGTDLVEGDLCGIVSANFMQDNFTGSVAVAGEGCTSGDDKNCLCGPDFNNPDQLDGFLWQCNGAIEFGPKGNKTCPATVPVVYEVGVNSQAYVEDQDRSCNMSDHPTGYPGDESCPYEECNSTGYSAYCACFDAGSEGESRGPEWVCLHSTCDCFLNDTEKNMTDGGSAPVMTPVNAPGMTPVMAPVRAPARAPAASSSASSVGTPFIFASITFCVAYLIAGL